MRFDQFRVIKKINTFLRENSIHFFGHISISTQFFLIWEKVHQITLQYCQKKGIFDLFVVGTKIAIVYRLIFILF